MSMWTLQSRDKAYCYMLSRISRISRVILLILLRLKTAFKGLKKGAFQRLLKVGEESGVGVQRSWFTLQKFQS